MCIYCWVGPNTGNPGEMSGCTHTIAQLHRACWLYVKMIQLAIPNYGYKPNNYVHGCRPVTQKDCKATTGQCVIAPLEGYQYRVKTDEWQVVKLVLALCGRA